MPEASKDLQKKINELSQIFYKAVTILSKCKSCGTCIAFCPLKLRKFNKDGKAVTINTIQSCGGCTVCFHRCPEHAIELIKLPRKDLI
jgi:2-oxoglutarate ferredoxin oxidoreductase subunit delta